MRHASAASIKSNKRQIQDVSSFAVLLKSKHDAIRTEIDRLNAETSRMEREGVEERELQRGHADLLENVKGLEGTLADFNIAFEKYRDGTDPDKISDYQRQLAAKNKIFAEEVDQVFLTKTQYERDNAKLQVHISDFFIRAEEFIRKTEPEKFDSFHILLRQSNELSTVIEKEENNLNYLRGVIFQAEHTMVGKSLRAEFKHHEKRTQELKTELIMGQDDLKILQMKPKDAHAHQLEKLKQFQRQIAALDEAIVQCESQRAELKRVEETLGVEVSQENSFRRFDSGPSEHEIVLFLQKFEDTQTQLKRDQEGSKACIVDLLERISDSIALIEDDLPTREEYEEMKSTAAIKSRHLQTSQETMERLQEQKTKRMQEVRQAFQT